MSRVFEVTAPDGKTYEVTAPDGATEAQVLEYAKSQFSQAPKEQTRQQIYEDTVKKRGWGSGVPAAIHELGGKVTDLTGSPAAGAVANFLGNAVPAALTSGRVAESAPLLEGPAKWLLQSAVKPVAADRKSGDAGRAMGTMLKENIYPTMGGMDKATKIAGKLEEGVEAGIARSTANVGVPAVTSRLDDPMQRFGMQVNPQSDTAALQAVKEAFLANPHIAGKSEIPVQLAHEMKKGTYRALGGKSYGEVGSASTEGQKALARGLREETGAAVPGIVELLKREAALMNVKDVAMNRALVEANKNPLGLAALRMDHPFSATMTLADRWAALKAFAAMQMYGGSKAHVIGPLGVTAGALQPESGILYRK